MFLKLLFQPVRPFETTQSVNYKIKPGLFNKLLSIKPLSTLLFRSAKFKRKFTHCLINERIVEVPFVFQHLPRQSKARILDIGCCESTLSISLATLGYEITGVDLRPYELIHPNFSFVQGDMCRVQLPSNIFDMVISLSTLEHIGLESIYGSPASAETSDRAVISVIKRVLKPGGILLLTVPSASQPYKDKFMRAYTPTQLNKMLKGFKSVSIQFYRTDPNRQVWKRCQPNELDSYPNFGVALVEAIKQS